MNLLCNIRLAFCLEGYLYTGWSQCIQVKSLCGFINSKRQRRPSIWPRQIAVIYVLNYLSFPTVDLTIFYQKTDRWRGRFLGCVTILQIIIFQSCIEKKESQQSSVNYDIILLFPISSKTILLVFLFMSFHVGTARWNVTTFQMVALKMLFNIMNSLMFCEVDFFFRSVFASRDVAVKSYVFMNLLVQFEVIF